MFQFERKDRTQIKFFKEKRTKFINVPDHWDFSCRTFELFSGRFHSLKLIIIWWFSFSFHCRYHQWYLGLWFLNGETIQSNRWMGESSCLRAIELYRAQWSIHLYNVDNDGTFSDGIEQISARVQFQTHVLTTPIISKSQINNRSFYL